MQYGNLILITDSTGCCVVHTGQHYIDDGQIEDDGSTYCYMCGTLVPSDQVERAMKDA